MLGIAGPSASPASLPYKRCGWLDALKTAENGAGFFGALLKEKELPVLKPLKMSGFGFPSLKHPMFGFIMTHEGIETDCGV